MPELKTVGLFALTALAKIIGCYLPYVDRVYAAYGSVYISMAILWLWTVNGIRPTSWDILGSAVALVGMAIIMFAPRST